jgi:hypothetical protein
MKELKCARRDEMKLVQNLISQWSDRVRAHVLPFAVMVFNSPLITRHSSLSLRFESKWHRQIPASESWLQAPFDLQKSIFCQTNPKLFNVYRRN